MSEFTFFKAIQVLREIGEMPPMGGPPMGGGMGGPPMGGGMPPGGDPMGGPPMGGGMGGPPMGGGMGGDPMGGPTGEPIPVKTIPVADAWKAMERIISDPSAGNFFQEIHISKRKREKKSIEKNKKSSLLK